MTTELVPLKDALRLSIDSVPVEPSQTYPIAGVYSFGRGLLSRPPILGSETTYKTLNRLHRDDFVLSQLKGWGGALARVTDSHDGWFLSPQFPTFRAVPDRLDIVYLAWYCKQSKAWEKLRDTARGMGARRDSVSPERFLSLEIPLPSLLEQRRIVARIEELAAKINEARGLRRKSADETALLRDATSRLLFGEPDREVAEIADVTKLAGFEYTKYLAGASPGEVILVRAGNVRDGGLDLSNAATIPREISDQLPRSQLSSCDIVMTFIGAKIGDVTFVSSSHPRLHCGPNVAKLRPHPVVDHRYLTMALQAPVVQDQIREITKLTAQPNPSMKTIRKLRLPVPVLSKQYLIVAQLAALQAQMDALKKLQAETTAELRAAALHPRQSV
jgi:hypothetical protein